MLPTYSISERSLRGGEGRGAARYHHPSITAANDKQPVILSPSTDGVEFRLHLQPPLILHLLRRISYGSTVFPASSSNDAPSQLFKQRPHYQVHSAVYPAFSISNANISISIIARWVVDPQGSQPEHTMWGGGGRRFIIGLPFSNPHHQRRE